LIPYFWHPNKLFLPKTECIKPNPNLETYRTTEDTLVMVTYTTLATHRLQLYCVWNVTWDISLRKIYLHANLQFYILPFYSLSPGPKPQLKLQCTFKWNRLIRHVHSIANEITRQPSAQPSRLRTQFITRSLANQPLHVSYCMTVSAVKSIGYNHNVYNRGHSTVGQYIYNYYININIHQLYMNIISHILIYIYIYIHVYIYVY